jgi:hypothetical protein
MKNVGSQSIRVCTVSMVTFARTVSMVIYECDRVLSLTYGKHGHTHMRSHSQRLAWSHSHKRLAWSYTNVTVSCLLRTVSMVTFARTVSMVIYECDRVLSLTNGYSMVIHTSAQVCGCVEAHISMQAQMQACTYAYSITHTVIRAHTHTHIHTHTSVACMCARMHTHLHTHTCAHNICTSRC